MNCQAIQNQILTLPDPRALPAPLREHIRACPACRAWARRAARLESILEQLPAPASLGEKKEALIGDLMAADPVILPMVVPAYRPGAGVVALRFLRSHAAAVGALAAAVLVAVAAIRFWPEPAAVSVAAVPTQKDPLLEKIVAGNAALARADSPARKLEELGKMTDIVAAKTREMARIASGTELKGMAGWYEVYVRDGIVPRAKDLQSQPQAMQPSEKSKLLESLAAQLGADATAADNLAKESPQDTQPALRRLADAAREGEKSLRAAAREGK
jgi:hypothetical protein